MLAEKEKKPRASKTARLLADGKTKIAKKVIEEASEVALDYVTGCREGVVMEMADLLYNSMVLLADMDIDPKEVWEEMDRRENAFGLAAKLPKKKRA
ncbi:MAG: phosphoribosyl-ATP diphosphatase [Aestuariibacter sp.]|nr:phosphoribosyl-ATP diphosphatase [Aestuariibacter sp.]